MNAKTTSKFASEPANHMSSIVYCLSYVKKIENLKSPPVLIMQKATLPKEKVAFFDGVMSGQETVKQTSAQSMTCFRVTLYGSKSGCFQNASKPILS